MSEAGRKTQDAGLMLGLASEVLSPAFNFSFLNGGEGGIGALSLTLIALVRVTGRASNGRSDCGNTLALCARLFEPRFSSLP